MKRLSENKTFELISAHIVEECARRGISGVFGIKQIQDPSQTRWSYIPQDRILDDLDGKTHKLLAMTLDKLNRVLVDRSIRGKPMRYFGEIAYQGKDGRRSRDRKFIYAFSGATEEVDAEIARLAEKFHRSLK